MWPFKRKCDCEHKIKEVYDYCITIAEELAKHLSNHDLQKDIHANCVSQEKVNDIICQLKRINK